MAAQLELTVVSPLAGGEFGALLVSDREGRHLILKALPSTTFAERFARGAALAMRMRSLGYPAPEYIGTGVALDATWSLQERLPGDVPDTPSPAHIRQLVALAERHAGAAVSRGDVGAAILRSQPAWRRTIVSHDKTRPFDAELAAAIAACEHGELFDDSIMHRDFHHRNFLAIGDEVTGVFDWEGAAVGDWRADLVNLAFWCAVLPGQIPSEAGRIAVDRAHEVCPPRVLAFFSASLAARQLDFDVREHPERLDTITTAIESHIAPWWRAAI